jgi:hypothetical protein
MNNVWNLNDNFKDVQKQLNNFRSTKSGYILVERNTVYGLQTESEDRLHERSKQFLTKRISRGRILQDIHTE